MTHSLSPTALRQLEQTLAQWQQWRGANQMPGAPRIVRQLGGHSNYTVLTEAAGQHFCVRLDRVNPAANGLNRQIEWRALQLAHRAGIAPRPRYFNPDIGALVCDYLPPDDKQGVQTEDIARLLQRIHALPGLRYRLDLRDRIRRYRRQLESMETEQGRQLEELDTRTDALLARVTATKSPLRLCHNDLWADNLLCSGGKPYALDWEYCAMGDPWFDLAVAQLNNGTGTPLSPEALLSSYLNRPANEADLVRLEQWRHVAAYLALLWYLCQRPGLLDPGELNTRLEALQHSADKLNL